MLGLLTVANLLAFARKVVAAMLANTTLFPKPPAILATVLSDADALEAAEKLVGTDKNVTPDRNAKRNKLERDIGHAADCAIAAVENMPHDQAIAALSAMGFTEAKEPAVSEDTFSVKQGPKSAPSRRTWSHPDRAQGTNRGFPLRILR